MLDLIIKASLTGCLLSALCAPIIGEFHSQLGMFIALSVATLFLVVAALCMLWE